MEFYAYEVRPETIVFENCRVYYNGKLVTPRRPKASPAVALGWLGRTGMLDPAHAQNRTA